MLVQRTSPLRIGLRWLFEEIYGQARKYFHRYFDNYNNARPLFFYIGQDFSGIQKCQLKYNAFFVTTTMVPSLTLIINN
jgi:hypothetical protein